MPVSRVLLALGAALVALVALVAGVAAMAAGPQPARSGELRVGGLSAPVRVAWPDSGGVVVEARTEADAAAGLGLAHATDHAPALAVWRQAARGTLAEWPDRDGWPARTLDLHARRMGFDALARETYAALAPPERARLDAYARGVNAAFAQRGVAQAEAFVRLGVTLDPWQPWDALAVERLVAYLGTPAPDSLWAAAAADAPDVAAFVRADSLFRDALGVRGASHGRAFAAGTSVVLHLPGGTSAFPLAVPVALRVGGREAVVASVPGTLSMPAGRAGADAWGVLLTSDLTLEPFAGAPPLPVYSRVVGRDGDETLVAARRTDAGLVLGQPRRPPARPDSAAADSLRAPGGVQADSLAADSLGTGLWRVRWAGFAPGTDAGAFARLLAGRSPERFALLRGDGVAVRGGGLEVLGAPPVRETGAGWTLVAGHIEARRAGPRLEALARAGAGADALARDAVSPWARERLVGLLVGLGPRDSLARPLETPASYLRSWDGAYTPAAIAPTLFEAWLAAHRDLTGAPPEPADSLGRALLPYTLRIARAELRDGVSREPADWRWGARQVAASGGVRPPLLSLAAPGRYPAAPAGGGGHPTALRPGPAPGLDGAPADADAPGPALVTFWTDLRGLNAWVRAPRPGRASYRADERIFGVPGAAVGLALGRPLPARRLVLSPTR